MNAAARQGEGRAFCCCLPDHTILSGSWYRHGSLLWHPLPWRTIKQNKLCASQYTAVNILCDQPWVRYEDRSLHGLPAVSHEVLLHIKLHLKVWWVILEKDCWVSFPGRQTLTQMGNKQSSSEQATTQQEAFMPIHISIRHPGNQLLSLVWLTPPSNSWNIHILHPQNKFSHVFIFHGITTLN